MESPNKCRINNGFTLVELSIVMIIIGLLIGGIFGGMKLVDNANVQKTVQELKSIHSATVTFKYTYRALPGDIPNPSSKLADCLSVPCATGGNNDRRITIGWNGAIGPTDENYTFWHHLQAANLISMSFRNATDMSFGEGQPQATIGGGYRAAREGIGTSADGCRTYDGSVFLWVGTTQESSIITNTGINCQLISRLDSKMDDGMPNTGKLKIAWNMGSVCYAETDPCSSPYSNNGSAVANYDFSSF